MGLAIAQRLLAGSYAVAACDIDPGRRALAREAGCELRANAAALAADADVLIVAAAEALALVQRLGLDAAATLAVIEESSGHSWIASDRARRLVAGDTTALARMTLLAKDSALALAVAQDAGVDNTGLPVSTSAAATFAAALQDGLTDEDDSALFRRALLRLSPPSAAAAP